MDTPVTAPIVTASDTAIIQRIVALRTAGKPVSWIAEDPAVVASDLMVKRTSATSRSRAIYEVLRNHADWFPTTSAETTKLKPTEADAALAYVAPILERHSRATGEPLMPELVDRFENRLRAYEDLIRNYSRKPARKMTGMPGRREIVVCSDIHCTDERTDLIARLIDEQAGRDLIVAGDLFDFSSLSRYTPTGWSDDSLTETMARGTGLLTLFNQHFRSVTLMLGNHDARGWKKALNTCGTEYGKLCHEWMIYALEHKYGVKVIDNPIAKQNGKVVEGLHFWHQLGDCLVTHFERAGAQPGRSPQLTCDFFREWQEPLGIQPFRVILQAHDHKVSYHRSRDNKVHCYGIGCLSDWADYALQGRPVYAPPQHGYYRLVQYDGVTSINESQLYSLDD